MSEQPGFVPITYNGPLGSHIVPSPTRKVRNYGLRTRGDHFSVHPDDIAASPDVFIPVPALVLEAPVIEVVVVQPPEPESAPAPATVDLFAADAETAAPEASLRPPRRSRAARSHTDE